MTPREELIAKISQLTDDQAKTLLGIIPILTDQQFPAIWQQMRGVAEENKGIIRGDWGVSKTDAPNPGQPDLIIHALSPIMPDDEKETQRARFGKHGVREYWVVDVDQRSIEVYTEAPDELARHGVFGPGESFTSPVLGDKTVDVDAILGEG